MTIKSKNTLVGISFALPSVLGLMLFYIIPFGMSISYSVTKGIRDIKFVGIENFISLFKSKAFILALKNTIKFNVISVPLIIIVSLLLALLLNSKLKYVGYFRSLFIIPLIIPVASVILFFQLIFTNLGMMNGILDMVGLQPISWLTSGYSFYVLIFIYIWKNCGYNMIIFLAGLNNIPYEYYEAARIDGAGKVTCFFSITLPFLLPSLFFVFIISIINSFKVFREAYLLAGSYPHKDIYMIQHFMNNNFFNLNNQRLSTSAIIMVFIITITVTFFYKLQKKGSIDSGGDR